MIEQQAIADKIKTMKQIAMLKAANHNGSDDYIREIEATLDLIAQKELGRSAPLHENLIGLAYLLLAEIKRARLK